MNVAVWRIAGALGASASLFAAPDVRMHSSPDRPPRTISTQGTVAEPLALVAEHRYRMIGMVRLVFFWVDNNNVGGARVTWRSDGKGARAITLLIGSEPDRAPRRTNQWGYVREEVRGNTADVFGVRSVTDADSLDEAEARLAEGTGSHLFGAMCSTVTPTEARALVTNVRVRQDVTYRDFAGLLETIGAAPRWEPRRATRAANAQPGFLMSLEHLIHTSVQATQRGAGSVRPPPPVEYVYKGAVFDLRLSRTERISESRIGSEIFRNLLRGAFTIHNHATGAITEFTVTYGTEGALANVPVYATYQPNWWFKVELALDKRLDLPADPAGDEALLARIRGICRAAGEKHPR